MTRIVDPLAKAAVAGEHLEGGEIGERDAHRFGGIDAIGDRHEETRGADRVLGVAADDAEIGDHLALAWLGYAGAGLLDDADEVVTRRERQRPLEVRIASTPNEGIGEAGAGGEYLDADLAGAGFGIVVSSASSRTSGPPNRGYGYGAKSSTGA